MGSCQWTCAITRLPIGYGEEVFAFVYTLNKAHAYRRSTGGLKSLSRRMHQNGILADASREWLDGFSPWFGFGTYNDYGWVHDENGREPSDDGNNIWMVHRWVAREVHQFETSNMDYTGGLLFALTEFAFCARIELFQDAYDSRLGQQYADARDRERYLLLTSMIQRGIAAREWY